MEERISLVVRKANYPELYQLLIESKKGAQSYGDILTAVLKENESLKKQVVKQNDWTGMRLALRATEKNSRLTVELLNNWFLHQSFEPVASHDQKSRHLLKFERDWKNYLTELQAERSTHKPVKSLQDFGKPNNLVMPKFDFSEEDDE